MNRLQVVNLVACMVIFTDCVGRLGAQETNGFRLREFLGREWRNELVTFSLEGDNPTLFMILREKARRQGVGCCEGGRG
jgi:hypothetical protein